VNRTLRPGPELERVREGVANYQKMQRLLAELLVRQAKLDASGRVRVPAKEGLTTHFYRVLQRWRRLDFFQLAEQDR
jgi:hypothetical protein